MIEEKGKQEKLSIFSLDRTDAGRKHFFARNILGIGYYDS
jgi:hypothetical protein